MSTVAEQLAAHTEALRPKRQVYEPLSASRWLGTTGLTTGLNESERKLLEACKRDGVSWSETKRRILQLREDMKKLKAPKSSVTDFSGAIRFTPAAGASKLCGNAGKEDRADTLRLVHSIAASSRQNS
jgi:hypothetical protein